MQQLTTASNKLEELRLVAGAGRSEGPQHVGYFMMDPNSISGELIFDLQNKLNCRIDVRYSWINSTVAQGKLSRRIASLLTYIDTCYIVRAPAVLLIDSALFVGDSMNAAEIVDAILDRMAHLTFSKNMSLAVVIEHTCSMELVKELQNTKITGIVPSGKTFGASATSDAVAALLTSQPHWPRDVVDRLNQIHWLARQEEQSQKPNVIYFFKDWQHTTVAKNILAVEKVTDCCISMCESWPQLIEQLGLGAKFIAIHMDMIRNQNVTIQEFINTATIMAKIIRDSGQVNIAVIIDRSCTPELIKEFRSTEILGIIPGMEDFGQDEFAKSITALINASSHWPKDVIDQLSPDAVRGASAAKTGIYLTERQQQVMHLVCNRGLGNKAIANMLKISESTVKIHVSAVMKEYGVRNRTQLAVAVGALKI